MWSERSGEHDCGVKGRRSGGTSKCQHDCGRYCGKAVGKQNLPYVQKYVDQILLVDDDELVGAFLDMVENHKMIVENSGLLTVAALKHLNVEKRK